MVISCHKIIFHIWVSTSSFCFQFYFVILGDPFLVYGEGGLKYGEEKLFSKKKLFICCVGGRQIHGGTNDQIMPRGDGGLQNAFSTILNTVSNWTGTHNHLWMKWVWIRVQLQSLKLQISCLLWARSSLTLRQINSVDHSETRTWHDNIQSETFSTMVEYSLGDKALIIL